MGNKKVSNNRFQCDYLGKIVDVTREKVTDYGVTWVEISLNGEVLGWIAKDALKIQTYAQDHFRNCGRLSCPELVVGQMPSIPHRGERRDMKRLHPAMII